MRAWGTAVLIAASGASAASEPPVHAHRDYLGAWEQARPGRRSYITEYTLKVVRPVYAAPSGILRPTLPPQPVPGALLGRQFSYEPK
jgi:hypothetical protein